MPYAKWKAAIRKAKSASCLTEIAALCRKLRVDGGIYRSAV
jgi:hypothetical protein